MAVKIRKHVIEMLYRAASGHPGGSLSAVDALVALYFRHMRYDPIEIALFSAKVMLHLRYMPFLQKAVTSVLMN